MPWLTDAIVDPASFCPYTVSALTSVWFSSCSQVAATVPGITSSFQQMEKDYLSLCINFKGKKIFH